MTTEASRAFLEAVRVDLDTHTAVVLTTRLPESLDAGIAEVLRACLDESELRRLSEIQAGTGADAFLVSRALLRTVLGHLLDLPGRNVELRTSGRGKPSLSPNASPPVYFNTSHSRTHAVTAVSRIGELGVDVEEVRSIDERVVRRSLSTEEYEGLTTLQHDERVGAFFHLWTVKEACAKATGVGIGLGMRNVGATLDRNGHWGDYSWESLDLGPGVAAALAIRTPGVNPERMSVAAHADVLTALFGIGPRFAPGGRG
jgi:phosphopantetheinyl transferase